MGCASIPLPTLGALVRSAMDNGFFQSLAALSLRTFFRGGHCLKTEPFPILSRWLLVIV